METANFHEISSCWCGCADLEVFNDKYKKCKSCSTLINTPRQVSTFYNVENDENSFYGKNYWITHVNHDFGQPDIFQRSRRDMSERCLYWLQNILQFKNPPGKALEIGSGPGAFVQIMKTVGFDATGLELSPWVAEYSRKTHGIEIINSKIEEVSEKIKSNDVIIMMDVLEHFTDPVESMTHIKKVLKSDGILVIQTPHYNHISYQQMLDSNDPFLIQFKDQEHLYLPSKEAITILLKRFGLNYIKFLEPLFPYDMFVIASESPLKPRTDEQIIDFLSSKPETLPILALLDLYQENSRLFSEAEMRLRDNEKLQQLLQESEKDRNDRLQLIISLERLLKESEKDRSDRLQSIISLERLLQESEQDRKARLESIHQLEKLLKEKIDEVRK